MSNFYISAVFSTRFEELSAVFIKSKIESRQGLFGFVLIQ